MTERRRRDPERTEARRHQILEAAAACFRRDGFRGASMAQISKMAGMSTGHIYHYFASKEEIVEAIVQRDQVHGLELIEKAKTTPNVAKQLLSNADECVRRPNKAHPALMLEIYAEAARNPTVAAIVRNCCSTVRAKLVEVLRIGQEQGSIDSSINVEEATRALMFIYDGLTTHMALFPEADTEDLTRMMADSFKRLACLTS